MKKKFLSRLRTAAAICMACAALQGVAFADGALIPGGETVGIQITVDGVLVAGMDEVETGQGTTVSPARDAGLRPGDVIVAVNGCEVGSAAGLAELIASLSGDTAEITVDRGGDRRSFCVSPARDADGVPRLGLLLRDGVSGIGTITYIDPDTGAFGALGHGVNDMDSGVLLPVGDGCVCRAQIVDIKRGIAGSPGELAGSISASDVLGRVAANTSCGIFGTMGGQYEASRQAVPVAEASEVVSGPATILACISGQAVREYDVEISRTGMAAGDGRDLLIHVTDPELLELTGGIVQGMSGSPILQDGCIVGAVTHVLVNDPTRGYGIFIENMLQAAENAA